MLKQASKEHGNIAIGHVFLHLQAAAIAPECTLMFSAVELLDLRALYRPTRLFHLREDESR